MPFSIGPLELVIVVIIAVAIFGAKRVPQLARSVGSGVHELRDALNLDPKEENTAETKHPPVGGIPPGSDSQRE